MVPSALPDVVSDPDEVENDVMTYPDPIAWGQDDGKTFDKAYDHRWAKNEWGGTGPCSDCGMFYNQWDGYPCLAKAEHVSFWIARQPSPVRE